MDLWVVALLAMVTALGVVQSRMTTRLSELITQQIELVTQQIELSTNLAKRVRKLEESDD